MTFHFPFSLRFFYGESTVVSFTNVQKFRHLSRVVKYKARDQVAQQSVGK